MSGDMVVGYMPNSDPWGPTGTPFMTIFVCYVNPQIPNIEHFEANEVYKSRKVFHLFSHQISVRMPSESLTIALRGRGITVPASFFLFLLEQVDRPS